jgi:tetratricopeptide (TPR) repeat protein
LDQTALAKKRIQRMTVDTEVRGAVTDVAGQGTCRIVEGGRGLARRRYIDALLAQGTADGLETHHISCRLETGGVWAGLADLLRALLPGIEAADSGLVVRHSYELALALPELRRRFPMTDASLTDSSPAKERVRSYPIDRAYRLLHGIIDLLAEWLPRHGARLLVVCEDFDDAGALMKRFFREFVRRRVSTLPLDLVFVVKNGGAAAAGAELGGRGGEVVRLACASDEKAVESSEMARMADVLEARLDGALGQSESYLPQLIQCCLASGQLPRAQHWRAVTLAVYNHFGYYEDALFFGEPLIADLDGAWSGRESFSRWHVISGLFNALVALGRPERAFQLVHDEALLKIDDPKDLVGIYYTLAMLHCRFLPQRDLATAEDYIMKSLEMVERSGLDESEKHYLTVFNHNGLAFIRHLQGRVAEATELCRSGFERLNRHLDDDQYRLHRSVLLYNIAQVHTSTRSYDEALAFYTAALEIDPRYSEYYNERGNVFLKMGRLHEAVADYRKAAELSAPYHEVFTNLGQAYKLLGDAAGAVDAYSRALDLDPLQFLPFVGRAQAYELAGDAESAMADYDAALKLDSSDAQTWSNRAVLHYDRGNVAEAVADLDQAINRASTMPELYANRAIALTDVGRFREAAQDHEDYLRLQPDALDRADVLRQITALQQQAAGSRAREGS